MKTAKQLERHFKGIANHYRIGILTTIAAHQGITVDELAKALAANFKTISQHTQSLTRAGLVDKKYSGRRVTHALSPYGKRIVRFVLEFQKIQPTLHS